MSKRGVIAALTLAALTACGGGGGNQVGGTAAIPGPPNTSVVGVTFTGATPSPSPAPTSASIQTTSVQRAVAGQTLTTFSQAQQAVAYNGTGALTYLSLRRAYEASAVRVTAAYRAGARRTAATAAAAAPAFSACQSGIETATVAVSTVEEMIYERAFYDGACTKLHADIALDVTATTSSSATANGTITLYDANGNAYSYETLAMTMDGVGTSTPQITVIATEAPSASAPATATLGLACALGTASLDCGLGGVTHQAALAQDTGATMTMTAQPTTTTSGTSVTVSGTATAYTGALGALRLSAGPFPSFVITGGTIVAGGSYSGSFGFSSSSTPGASTLTMNAPSSDGTVTMSSSSTGYAGTVKRASTGAVLATFTVDASGNGTITYGDGTTGRITAWQITG